VLLRAKFAATLTRRSAGLLGLPSACDVGDVPSAVMNQSSAADTIVGTDPVEQHTALGIMNGELVATHVRRVDETVDR